MFPCRCWSRAVMRAETQCIVGPAGGRSNAYAWSTGLTDQMNRNITDNNTPINPITIIIHPNIWTRYIPGLYSRPPPPPHSSFLPFVSRVGMKEIIRGILEGGMHGVGWGSLFLSGAEISGDICEELLATTALLLWWSQSGRFQSPQMTFMPSEVSVYMAQFSSSIFIRCFALIDWVYRLFQLQSLSSSSSSTPPTITASNVIWCVIQ